MIPTTSYAIRCVEKHNNTSFISFYDDFMIFCEFFMRMLLLISVEMLLSTKLLHCFINKCRYVHYSLIINGDTLMRCGSLF